jgi:hypothetical protein
MRAILLSDEKPAGKIMITIYFIIFCGIIQEDSDDKSDKISYDFTL